jgi:hypothetical protein
LGKCVGGHKNAARWSSLRAVDVSASGNGLVNGYYFEDQGEELWLTEPGKVVEAGHLRPHALFGGSQGQQLQEWKFKAA